MKTIQMRGIVAAVSGALLLCAAPLALADSTDDIINALIGKGVLTEEEGALLMKGRAGEKEVAEKKKAGEVKASFKDGLKFESGDKETSIKLIGRLQADYRNFDYSETDSLTGGGAPGADTFDMRRARLGFEGTYKKYYKFKVQTDMSTTNKLDEAYLNIGWWKQAQFRFGQFKMPGMLEEQTSSNNIDFMERSMANGGVAGKERGAMVHGAPLKGMTYALAFSTGQGQNKAEEDIRVDSIETNARVTANFAEMMGNKDMVLHAGLSYTTTDMKNDAVIGYTGNSEGKGVTFFTPTSIAAIANNTEVERDRAGIEAAVAYGPFKFQSEWAKVGYDFDNTGTTATDDSLDIDTWYAQAVWNITGEAWAKQYKGGAWGGLKPAKDFNPDGSGWGAWQVGVRYSKFEADDGFASTGSVGFLEADAWTMGVNFYPNANTRIMLNYVRSNFENQDSAVPVNGRSIDDERAIMTRVQWAF